MVKWLAAGVAAIVILAGAAAFADPAFEGLAPGQVIASFRTECVYDNEAGRAMGARFRHLTSGFVLDLLRIQSVAQAFMWINSPPPSDQGEPHTCEHLLLGKGTRGRYVASLEEMSLGQSSAFTMQLRTCYHFHTAAGADVFYQLLEAKLDALLHPTFSDEEIRREVCNLGVTADPETEELRLEEKGTVYNEMVSSYERPWSRIDRELSRFLYGRGHPMALESGGFPDSIRTMGPEDLRRFHRETHHLSNMGMIVTIPGDIPLADCLERLSAILARIEPDARPGPDPAATDARLPAPRPGQGGAIALADFPHQNADEPGLLLFGWPPLLDYDNNEGYLLDLLVANLASGETSNLYRRFIDSQTRSIDIGASDVFGWTTDSQGHPFYIGFENVKRNMMEEAKIDSIRALILAEIRQIADLADGSAELRAFNDRARNRVIERRRSLRKFLSSPPGFGFRGIGSEWMEHLKHLQGARGFRKSLALAGEIEFGERLLAGERNFWREVIDKWHLADRAPFAVGARANPELIEASEAERAARLEEAAAALATRYRVKDRKATLRRFKADYDVATAAIEEVAQGIELPRFVDQPPLTLDDQLHYRQEEFADGGTLVTSTFDHMTGGTVGLAFRMNVIPESLLIYLPALPILLTEVGVLRHGKPLAYDGMKEAIRREILDLTTYYSLNHRSGRAELVARASGTDSAEVALAMEWLETVLFAPDWRAANLPRIRDTIDAALAEMRDTMRDREESWVHDPANAYWKQGNPLLLSAGCFLTQTHALHRLRWRLRDLGSAAAAREFREFMARLAAAGMKEDRAELTRLAASLAGEEPEGEEPETAPLSESSTELLALLAQLSPRAREAGREAGRDLRQTLPDIPDSNLAADWHYLCQQMAADASLSPEAALDDLREVMGLLLRADNVRAFLITGTASENKAGAGLQVFGSRLAAAPSQLQTYGAGPRVLERMRERYPDLDQPRFVGLMNENTRSGVFINVSDCASYLDFDRESLLRFLAARLYGGGGAHSMFMKTWGAGLAYSNGLRSDEASGRLMYYAERCPDLAQTLQFVVNELQAAPHDTALAQYALAQAFAVYRGASPYEVRGEAIAADLADQVTPERVRRFRSAILELRSTPDLYGELRSRMESTYAAVVPGYGSAVVSGHGNPGGTANPAGRETFSFIIGPEKQFESYEGYLRRNVSARSALYRIYPRDYWLVDPIPN